MKKNEPRSSSSAATMGSVRESFQEAIKALDTPTVRTILTTHRGLLNLNNLEKDEQYSHLMLAALAGSLEITRLLVEQGRCDPNIQNQDGQSALMFAAYKGHAEVVAFLLDKGARRDFVDNVGQSALDLAANEEIRALLSGVKAETTTESATDISPTQSPAPQRHRSVLQDVFSDADALSSLVSQSMESNASTAVDYCAILREKQNRLAEAETDLKVARALAEDLEQDRERLQSTLQSEVLSLNEQLAELTVKFLNASEQVEEQKKLVSEQTSLNDELQTRINHIEHELNKVTAELDKERSVNAEKEKEIERFAAVQCSQEEEMDRLRAKVKEQEDNAAQAPEHSSSAPTTNNESQLLLEQQRRYDTHLAEKDRQIAQLEKLVSHLTEEMELKGISAGTASDKQEDSSFCVVS